jgi:hypothetical protein
MELAANVDSNTIESLDDKDKMFSTLNQRFFPCPYLPARNKNYPC